MISNVWTFRLWSFSRTYVVPICIAVAMLAVMFSSALGVLPVLEKTMASAEHSGGLGRVVIGSLLIAGLLMLLHTVYLSLMAFHLVYRFPIENQRWIGLVYVFLVFAYVAHAVHAADTSHVGGFLAHGWESSLGFALVYGFMFVHGRHDGEDRRPTQLQRAHWMRRTDLGMLGVSVLMALRDLQVWNWSAIIVAIVPNDGVVQAIYRQSSPKDGIVAVALIAYGLTTWATHRKLRSGQPDRSDKVQRIQRFEFKEDHLKPIRDALPVNASWLDIGSGHGTQVYELLRVMYDTEITRLANITQPAVEPKAPVPVVDTSFPRSVVLLDRDRMTIDEAKLSNPEWWPKESAREFRHLDMNDVDAVSVLKKSRVAHMSHVAYRPQAVEAAVRFLRNADPGTYLLLRFTSNTSFYRVISMSTSCAPLRPYIHHHMHNLLIGDLERNGWQQRGKPVLLKRACDLSNAASVTDTVDWCDAQYGEFSGDIIDRYFKGLVRDEETAVPNCDRLVLLSKIA